MSSFKIAGMIQKKVLILGAGMVVKPMVNYLLEKKISVTVATRTISKAQAMIANHPRGTALAWTMDDKSGLDTMIAGHDLTVSLLPWTHHLLVANYCIKHKKNMVTTSYVRPEMRALDSQAKKAGIIILNELGLDPGIDHMSAMRIIDMVRSKKGKIEGFYSLCGAIPSPEAAGNPFRYKFSWSPGGVLLAGNNEGKFLQDSKAVRIAPEDLFKKPLKMDFPGTGPLEVYPNRDSLPYIGLYGIPETQTMVRGTFRYPGWCEILDNMKRLDMLSVEQKDFSGKTYAEFMAAMAGAENASGIRDKVASYLGLDAGSLPITAFHWLGLFENNPVNSSTASPFGIVSELMTDRMMLENDERDMVVMQHIFLASFPGGKKEVIRSSMLDSGSPAAGTAVARTVALPAAIGVEMILSDRISARGVHIPVIPEIYNPILDNLETMNIKMTEEYGLPEEEFTGITGGFLTDT
jgi:saccharopine dehydrogenase-like NADP-dependent oxidoreductase